MERKKQKTQKTSSVTGSSLIRRAIFGFLALTVSLSSAFAVFVWISKHQGYSIDNVTLSHISSTTPLTVFPVSVNAYTKQIYENPSTEAYVEQHFAEASVPYIHSGWFDALLSKLSLFEVYQNFASLSTRMVVIQPGERKEQIAQNLGKILTWSPDEQHTFLSLVSSSTPILAEGKFYPGRYTVNRDITPEEMASLVNERFNQEILARYTDEVSSHVALEDALSIASLLEREAYDFNDMRHISGVIWNRLFADMRLQIDASLQYAKGDNPRKKIWWQKVVPNDKFIESPYNTYAHEGLPPAPISNPSTSAIVAALNPIKTDCMYYFHDKNGAFYCTRTYEEHVARLKEIYGRGK